MSEIVDLGHERACRKIIGMCEKLARDLGYDQMTERDHATIRGYVASARAYRRTLSRDNPNDDRPSDCEAQSS